MDNHRRWYCRECKREWVEPRACYANSAPVSITGNPLNGSNCQVCGSPEIELVEYKPEYPGLDIPRDRLNKIVPTEIVSVIPGTVTSGSYSVRNEPLQGREAKDLIPPIHPPLMSINELDNEPAPVVPIKPIQTQPDDIDFIY